jgi:hypothetical protein
VDEAFHVLGKLIGAEIFRHRVLEYFGGNGAGRKSAENSPGRAVSDASDIGEIRFPTRMAEQAMVALIGEFTHVCRVQGSSGFFEK